MTDPQSADMVLTMTIRIEQEVLEVPCDCDQRPCGWMHWQMVAGSRIYEVDGLIVTEDLYLAALERMARPFTSRGRTSRWELLEQAFPDPAVLSDHGDQVQAAERGEIQ